MFTDTVKNAAGQCKRTGLRIWQDINKKRYLPGSGVVELILILVVLIALVILFRNQITELTDMIFGDIFSKAESVF